MIMQAGGSTICLGRRASRLAALSAEHGDLVRTVELDLSDPAATDGFLGELCAGDLDGVVLAAGHDLGGNTPFHAEERENWQSKLAVNAASAMRVASDVLPYFLSRDRGDIVAIGSVVTRTPAKGLASYAASKQALQGFMEGLRLDYADTGLRFIEIVPGVIRTEFAANRLAGDQTAAAAFYERFKGWLTPEDVGGAVIWALTQPEGVAVDEIVMRPTRR
jgi:NADP-dependent 3-hydroxy acid dehydrogenase YdfG